MAFIKRNKISRKVKAQMQATAGWREKNNMQNARYVASNKQGNLISFTAPNPDYGKRGVTTKSYKSTFNTKTGKWER